MSHDYTANFARLKFVKFPADARVLKEAERGCGQRLNDASRRMLLNLIISNGKAT
ncbi:hypothetical protein SBDP1_850051 [Syntrophobacter sp. SbD1]|nr:hypothetical protein SBDP1_850051 [Syntrophobacter sp. SbD1]